MVTLPVPIICTGLCNMYIQAYTCINMRIYTIGRPIMLFQAVMLLYFIREVPSWHLGWYTDFTRRLLSGVISIALSRFLCLA
jgi:hypothetical protein